MQVETMQVESYAGSERRAQARSDDYVAASDTELAWCLIRRRDIVALKSLIGRHAGALRKFLLRLSRNPHVAEDVMQQTWLTLLESLSSQSYRPTERAAFRTYLFTLARNRYLDEYTRKHVVSRTHYMADPLSDDSLPGEYIAPATEWIVERSQRDTVLRRALKDLPEAQREVITMWAQGWTVDEMVAHFGAPRDTILSRRKYAIRRLRAALSESG